MLFYKAWAESRLRFLIAALVITLAAVFVVGWKDPRLMFQGIPRTLFIIFAFVLGGGGLLHERELGTAAFTLALPVSRRRLTLTRALAGLCQLFVLAAIPAVVIAAGAPWLREPYTPALAVTSALRWLGGGAALFALSFLASAVLQGEYTPLVAALVVHFGHTVTTQFIRIARPATLPYMFTVQEIMSGLRPSLAIPTAVMIGIATLMIATASVSTERKDF